MKKAIELSFELDTELAGKVEVKQYKNGEWVKADSRVEDSHVVVAASEFASYGLFLGVEFSEKKSTEAVEFEQSKWDNLYGSKDMSVGEAAYTYKVGTEISTEGTVSKLTALLIEELAQRFGATATTLNGSYPIKCYIAGRYYVGNQWCAGRMGVYRQVHSVSRLQVHATVM